MIQRRLFKEQKTLTGVPIVIGMHTVKLRLTIHLTVSGDLSVSAIFTKLNDIES